MFKKIKLFSDLGMSILIGLLLLFLITFVPINGNIGTSIREAVISLLGDGYAVAASTTMPTGLQYPNPNYVYYNNAVTTSPATVVSSDTYSGDVDLYLKTLIVSNSSAIDTFVTFTSSETDAASTEIGSFLIPKANGVNQPTLIPLHWLDVNISSDTKLKVEASTTPGSGYVKVFLSYEKY